MTGPCDSKAESMKNFAMRNFMAKWVIKGNFPTYIVGLRQFLEKETKMVKRFTDWLYCQRCKKNVQASIVMESEDPDKQNRSVQIWISAICKECGTQLASGGANVDLE